MPFRHSTRPEQPLITYAKAPGMSGSRRVYSTEGHNSCPICLKPLRKCRCETRQVITPAADQSVRIRRETRQRAGKTVTVIEDATSDRAALKQLARQLKSLCGTGGSIKHGCIEIQGDHRQAITDFFQARGRAVKRVGG